MTIAAKGVLPMHRTVGLLWLLLIATVVTGCAATGHSNNRILLWHTWAGEEVSTLNEMIATYRGLNPKVEVISVFVPKDAIVSRVASRARSGLGPDIILTDASIIYDMAEQDLIRDLGPLDLDLSTYLSTAVRMVSDGTGLYGLPLSAHTHVLYYDRELVETPPKTIAELLHRIDGGEVLAQNPNFVTSYWGVGAYDGAFANGERELLFGQGGFTNWLDFLSTARTIPGFLMDDSSEALQRAFVDGEATYYVGDSAQVSTLLEAMGSERLGVSLLPSGPNGGAPSPFLELDAFAFGNISSADEFEQALDFALFLAGPENQLFLATSDIGLVPVNSQIRLTPSLPANTLTVARQIRSAEAISFVNRPIWKELTTGALDFLDSYRRVSQGILAPEDLVAQMLSGFEDVYGLVPPVVTAESLCPAQPGSVTIWNTLANEQAQVFDQLAREFEVVCTGITINIEEIPEDDLASRFATATRIGEGPDALFGSSRWLASLVEDGQLLDLTERVPASRLQQFMPSTVEAMRYGGRLYGVPESVSVLALYYNSTIISDPPIDVQQLVQSADANARLAMPVGFFWAYWGMNPFGGFDFDSIAGSILETGGLTTWLEELQSIDVEPGVDFYFDFSEAEDAFASGDAAYLVGGPSSLPRLRSDLGDENFRVVTLPNGPRKPGSPILRVQGTMISSSAADSSVDIALAFEEFVNLRSSQLRFLETGNHVTASVTIRIADYPNIESFRDQAKASALVVENNNFRGLLEQGDLLYESVLADGVAPAEAVPLFIDEVHTATGILHGDEEE